MAWEMEKHFLCPLLQCSVSHTASNVRILVKKKKKKNIFWVLTHFIQNIWHCEISCCSLKLKMNAKSKRFEYIQETKEAKVGQIKALKKRLSELLQKEARPIG